MQIQTNRSLSLAWLFQKDKKQQVLENAEKMEPAGQER